jgi:hypothetical protein
MLSKKARRRWRAVLAPQRAVPILLTAALIAALAQLPHIANVFHRWHALTPSLIGLLLLLALTYLALKGWQFGRLLKAAKLATDWRGQWAAFAVGEMTLILPLGMYAQNYVLLKSRGRGFAKSAAVTTLMHALEIAVLAVALAAIPVHSWPQMHEVLWGAIGLVVVLSFLLSRFHPLRRIATQLARHKGWIGKVARKGRDFLKEWQMLGKPHVLLHNVVITAAYLLALAVAFQHVGGAFGERHVELLQAVAIYAFGLLVAMLFGGIVSQLGTVELSAAAMASAMGFQLHNAIVMLIWFRLLWTASIWLIAGSTLIVLRRELLAPSSRSA